MEKELDSIHYLIIGCHSEVLECVRYFRKGGVNPIALLVFI